jgi:hypothetical protein
MTDLADKEIYYMPTYEFNLMAIYQATYRDTDSVTLRNTGIKRPENMSTLEWFLKANRVCKLLNKNTHFFYLMATPLSTSIFADTDNSGPYKDKKELHILKLENIIKELCNFIKDFNFAVERFRSSISNISTDKELDTYRLQVEGIIDRALKISGHRVNSGSE